MRCGEILDWLRTGQLLNKNSAPRSTGISVKITELLLEALIYIA
jgi:hypothetical protein